MIMERGKRICNVLKDVRKKIAEENGIEYVTSECQHKGDCAGTCPKCEAEVRYLESQLARRRMAGRTVRLAGISLGVAAVAPALVSCDVKGDMVDGYVQPPLAGDIAIPNVQLGDNLIFDLIPAEEFMPMFAQGGWIEAGIYDVYPDGHLGNEILADIVGYVPRKYAVKSEDGIKEYLDYDADPEAREYVMHHFSYLPYSNNLIIGQNFNMTVASITDTEMVCYGEVFSRHASPDAFLGKYVFRRVDDETVAQWDAEYVTPLE